MRRTPTTDLALVAVFTGLIAAFTLAPAVPVGPLGVPITLQTLAVALTAMVIGPWRGFAAVALYLVLGFAGLPIFAMGTGGPGVLARPSVGYLLAFPLAAVLIGVASRWFLRRFTRARAVWLFVAGLLGSIVFIHPLGILGMSINGRIPLDKAFLADIAYWPGDVVKNVLAALVAVAVLRAFPGLLGAQAPATRRAKEHVSVP